MTELTKEAFEQALSALATKEDLKGLATKADLAELRTHTDAALLGLSKQILELRTEMNTKLDAIFELLDVRKEVETLKKQMHEVQLRLKQA